MSAIAEVIASRRVDIDAGANKINCIPGDREILLQRGVSYAYLRLEQLKQHALAAALDARQYDMSWLEKWHRMLNEGVAKNIHELPRVNLFAGI